MGQELFSLMEDCVAMRSFRIFMDHWLRDHYRIVRQIEGRRRLCRIVSSEILPWFLPTTSSWALLHKIKKLAFCLLIHGGYHHTSGNDYLYDTTPELCMGENRFFHVANTIHARATLEKHFRSPASIQTRHILNDMSYDEIYRVTSMIVLP